MCWVNMLPSPYGPCMETQRLKQPNLDCIVFVTSHKPAHLYTSAYSGRSSLAPPTHTDVMRSEEEGAIQGSQSEQSSFACVTLKGTVTACILRTGWEKRSCISELWLREHKVDLRG